MAYEFLASSYDRMTRDIPYERILGFYRELLRKNRKNPETAVDLACGTGSMSLLLAKEGLRVLGVDCSEEMLTEAYAKAMCMEENAPYFIRQKLQNLCLPQPVDLAVCCLDGINYLTDPEDCKKTFLRVFKALKPGGSFIFDINSAAKLRGLDGQVWLDEDDDVYCVWRTDYNPQTRVCFYGMDIFRRKGELWERTAEEHREYAYTAEELTGWLLDAGFADVQTFGDCVLTPPAENEQRIFFAAIKE